MNNALKNDYARVAFSGGTVLALLSLIFLLSNKISSGMDNNRDALTEVKKETQTLLKTAQERGMSDNTYNALMHDFNINQENLTIQKQAEIKTAIDMHDNYSRYALGLFVLSALAAGWGVKTVINENKIETKEQDTPDTFDQNCYMFDR